MQSGTRIALILGWLALWPAGGWAGGAVATEHQLAADAGADVLRAGGTVVDAAIAAAAAVCVVHPVSCGIGGGSFALVHLANGQTAALDFREQAPAAATLDRYLRDGQPDPSRTRTGGLAVGVPGEVAGWVMLHARFGRLPLVRVLAPAIALAADGFPLTSSPFLQRELTRMRALTAADPGLRATFLTPDGNVPEPNFQVRNPDLADTLRAVARDGRRAFYEGPRAIAIADAVTARGGVLTTADLAAYEPRWRTPLTTTFHGRRIVTFPPPGGGALVLTLLGQLADDDLSPLLTSGGPWAHLLSGVMAQAFSDRARFYGDPDFTPIPLDRLLAPARLRALRARLRDDATVEPTREFAPDAGTAHVSVVDTDGNAAAITTTINTIFGAGIMVPGTGIILNNEMDDFSLAAGVANVYGLTGTDANLLAPGKRPQSSMSPTIVLRDGRPELVVGGSGGPMIISGVAQTILRVVGAGDTPSAAVGAVRLHDQASPPGVAVEPGFSADVRNYLSARGHGLRELPVLGAVAAVGVTAHGVPVGAGDLRKDGGVAMVEATPRSQPAPRRAPPARKRARG